MSSGSASSFREKTAHPLAGLTVLQIIPHLQGGASARAAVDIAAALSAIGANALVACQGGPMVSELQAKGGVFLPFPAQRKNPLGMVLNMRRLARLIATERIDLVHAASRAAAWVAYGATRLTKTPFVTNFQDAYVGGDAFHARYNSVMARGDVIIAGSAHAAAALVKTNPSAERRLHIVRRGVDCRLFAPKAVGPSRVQAVRKEWRVAPDERVALLAADFNADKGHRILVDAARLLIQQGLAGTKFILAGEDGGRPSLGKEIDRAIDKARLEQIIRRVGPVQDLPAALLAASVVIAPSARADPSTAVAIEAQAMGTPVIVADLGAMPEAVLAPPETVASQRTGWRTPAGDPRALAAAIFSVLNLGATARDWLALRARAHVEASFSMENFCARTLEAYCAAQFREDV